MAQAWKVNLLYEFQIKLTLAFSKVNEHNLASCLKAELEVS
jgi:hypothetical protein